MTAKTVASIKTCNSVNEIKDNLSKASLIFYKNKRILNAKVIEEYEHMYKTYNDEKALDLII